jgi:hypothetical protein
MDARQDLEAAGQEGRNGKSGIDRTACGKGGRGQAKQEMTGTISCNDSNDPNDLFPAILLFLSKFYSPGSTKFLNCSTTPDKTRKKIVGMVGIFL